MWVAAIVPTIKNILIQDYRTTLVYNLLLLFSYWLHKKRKQKSLTDKISGWNQLRIGRGITVEAEAPQCCRSLYREKPPVQSKMLQHRIETKLQRFAYPPGAFYSLEQRLSALSLTLAPIHVQNYSVHHAIMSHIPTEWINSRGCCSPSRLNLIWASLSCIDYTEYMSASLGKVPAWESAMPVSENRRNL